MSILGGNMDFSYKGKRISSVSFIGFGKSNKAVFSYLTGRYPDLKYTIRSDTEISDAPDGAALRLGKDSLSGLFEDLIFLSPTVRRDRSELALAKKRGSIISGDAEFFFENTKSDCYAVSGSDGKSTTATLSALLLKGGYTEARAAGNIGVPLTPLLDADPGTAYAVELSSFQLMDFAPKSKRAALLNITPNHLDWHKDFDEYVSAKLNLMKNAGEKVFSFDSALMRKIAAKERAFALFSAKHSLSEMKEAIPADLYFNIRDGYICMNGERLILTDKILKNEIYNLKNLMAALALTYGAWNCGSAKEVAQSFGGLPHRCELIYKSDKLRVYNSSIDSSPERTKATLASFPYPNVILLGGRSKGLDYSILAKALGNNTRYAVICGENREEIANAIKDASIPIYVKDDFEEAAKLALSLSYSVGALLFSPASTSFDRFSSFEERGRVFKEIIQKSTKDV